MTGTASYLKKLKRTYLALRSAELFLYSLGSACILLCMALLSPIPAPLGMLLSVCGGILVFSIGFFALKLHKVDAHQLISYINQKYSQMEQSADLLLMKPAQLTTLQQIQQQKVRGQLESVYRSITFPNRITTALLFSGTSIALSFGLYFLFQKSREDVRINHSSLEHGRSSPAELPASIKEFSVRVKPPAYTRRPAFETREPDLIVAAGSIVSWHIVFTDSVLQARFIFSGRDSALLTGTINQTFERRITESSLYRVSWQTLSGEERFSRHYKIDVIHDAAPNIQVPDQLPVIELDPDDERTFSLKSNISDDYGVKDAYIIATVSKGTGEAVKFREEKIRFQSPVAMRGRNINAVVKLDLLTMGLEPGDELYFYVEAIDNRIPSANRSRSETFFVSLRDTASYHLAVDGAMTVDVMPEYFRSQRQIIIDSEKLLREKKAINNQAFNRRSNELGYDQKMLRLKYGEFLGEEFEGTIGPAADVHAEKENGHSADKENTDPRDEYTHRHDFDNEHNLPEKKEDPMEAYRHVHDDPEEATFFSLSIRTKLKAALSLMWEAELHLRLARPARSLPYQYKALKLLKEISEASRVYVHRTGFDPPPLKEEKRLTGDLSAVRNARSHSTAATTPRYPAIEEALHLVEEKVQEAIVSLTTEEKAAILRAGNELAALSLEEPGKHLEALAAANSLHEDQLDDHVTRRNLLVLRTAFWTALPDERASPVKTTRTHHPLDRKFAEVMQSIKK